MQTASFFSSVRQVCSWANAWQMSRWLISSCSMSRQRRSTEGQKLVSTKAMSSGQGPAAEAASVTGSGGVALALGEGRMAAALAEAASTDVGGGGASFLLHAVATRTEAR